MSEQRRNEIMQQFRRPKGSNSSRSKDIKTRFAHIRSKQTFLTDTQTSDYTKSSGQINMAKRQMYQETIRKLEKENSELKQKVVQLKKNHFFQINQEKLKSIIKENDKLRYDYEKMKKEHDESLIQRDFLQRFNKNLKIQCENLTKQILILKGNSNSNTNQNKKFENNIYTSRNDNQTSKNKNSSKNSSHDHSNSAKKQDFLYWKKEKEQKNTENTGNLLKNSMSASRLHDDYYPSRTSRNNKTYKNI